MFTAVLLASAVPVLAFGFVDSYWGLIVVGFFLGIAGASFAVGVPFVAGWYPKERQGFALGVYGMGNIGTAVAAFTAPAVVNHWGRPTLGVAAALVMVLAAVVFYSMAENPPRGCAAALRGGAALGLAPVPARASLLPHLRRLRRDGDLPAEAAQGLVRLFADAGRPACRRLHARRDGGAAGRRLALRQGGGPGRADGRARSASRSTPPRWRSWRTTRRSCR